MTSTARRHESDTEPPVAGAPSGRGAGGGRGATGTMSIGQVLAALRGDFPDVSISKIRFLQEQGLVEPQRTPSGYRRFCHADVERLRYVLAAQRDRYLPLRVIREQLDAIDRGMEPPASAGEAPRVPRVVHDTGVPGADRYAPRTSGLRLSRSELCDAAAVEAELVSALESFGLIHPLASGHFDVEAVKVTQAAGELARFGIEPRHLRAFRLAADRELGLVDQVVTSMRHSRDPGAAARADDTAREISAACVRLHAAVVSAGLTR